MMMTVASLIVPLSIRYIEEPKFHYAALTMIGFCILTVVLSAYATMPKLNLKNRGKSRETPRPADFNILFFASFSGMTLPEFETEMEAVMNDPNRVYETQVNEIYVMGRYLQNMKYRFLGMAYAAFITGTLISSCFYIAGAYMYEQGNRCCCGGRSPPCLEHRLKAAAQFFVDGPGLE